MKVQVSFELAAKALQLCADEANLLEWRRQINRKLREVKLRRLALVLDQTAQDIPPAPSADGGTKPDGTRKGGRHG